jgi:hypothetical protein
MDRSLKYVQMYVAPEKTLPHNLACFLLLLFLTIDQMEGCAPSLVFGTKNGEVPMEGESMKSFSLP